MVKAELAVIALLLDLFEIAWLEFGEVAFVCIDPVEQGVKRGAEVKASPASITDIIDSQGFLV